MAKKQTFRLGDSGVMLESDKASEYVRVKAQKGDEGVLIKKTDLWTIWFAIADEKTQEQLLPVKKTIMSQFERVHQIRLKTDMKAGEVVTAKCLVDVEKVVRDGIAANAQGVPLVPAGKQT